ncbi:MAG: ribosomal protein S18-alanine N-acetyltransferase [Anaerolineaceae bacterium]|nr:ribosomal protein S18-alanine N-acetyltransferase [Anaerolineaceae bacterium]
MVGAVGGTQVILRPMTLSDLQEVEALDRDSFPTPWPLDAFRYELTSNPHSICWVAELTTTGLAPILVGSIVVWLVVDEAHVATLAVNEAFRRHGVARQLLAQALGLAYESGARQAMLEVRASNKAAQNLYAQFGFEPVGLRKAYYHDTHEDAILMTLAELNPDRLAELSNNEDH